MNAIGGKSLLGDVLVEAPVGKVGQPDTTYDSSDTRHIVVCYCIMAFLNDEVKVGVFSVFAVYGEVEQSVPSFRNGTIVAC